jgi:hypothetical protein
VPGSVASHSATRRSCASRTAWRHSLSQNCNSQVRGRVRPTSRGDGATTRRGTRR